MENFHQCHFPFSYWEGMFLPGNIHVASNPKELKKGHFETAMHIF